MSQQTEVDWVVSWIERISQVGFGVSMGLILFGSYLGIWIWGRAHKERIAELCNQYELRIAELQARLEEQKKQTHEWKDMALGLLTPLETTLRGSTARLPPKAR